MAVEVWIVQSGFRYEGYGTVGLFLTLEEAFAAANTHYEKGEPHPSDMCIDCWVVGGEVVGGERTKSYFRGGSFERSDWEGGDLELLASVGEPS